MGFPGLTPGSPMNFLFMIGLRPKILVRTARIGQKSEELINAGLIGHLHFQILGVTVPSVRP
jgi:hypothetical protein